MHIYPWLTIVSIIYSEPLMWLLNIVLYRNNMSNIRIGLKGCLRLCRFQWNCELYMLLDRAYFMKLRKSGSGTMELCTHTHFKRLHEEDAWLCHRRFPPVWNQGLWFQTGLCALFNAICSAHYTFWCFIWLSLCQ